MKKISLILISLLVCLSMLLVGCNAGNDPTPTSKPTTNNNNALDNNSNNENNQNGGNVPQNPVDKEAILGSFNELELGTIFDSLAESELGAALADYMAGYASGSMTAGDIMTDVLPMFNDIAAGIAANVTVAGDTAKIDAAVKDGIVFTKVEMLDGETNENTEGYICFGKGELMLFQKNPDGVWEGMDPFERPEATPLPEIEPMADLVPNEEQDEMMAQIKQMVESVVIPELKAEHVTEENGMLVLNNEYLVELAGANAGLIGYGDPNYEISPEDLEDGKEEIRKALSAIGLKIAVGGNGETITKIAISIDMADTEEGKQLQVDSGIAAASIVLESNADATLLNSVKFSITNDFSDILEGYMPTSTVDITMVYTQEGKLCGAKVKADATMMVSNGGSNYSDEQGNYTRRYTSTFSKIALDFSIDMNKIGKADEDVMTLNLGTTVEKAVEKTYTGNYNNVENEQTTTTELTKETNANYFDDTITVTAKLTSTDKNKLSFTGSAVPGEEGAGTIDVTAIIYLNDILNFPTEIPTEIQTYMNAAE